MKRNRPQCQRCRAAPLLLWVAASVWTQAAPYLPAVGPAPLRFARPTPPLVLTLLPPLLMREPEPLQPLGPPAPPGLDSTSNPPIAPATVVAPTGPPLPPPPAPSPETNVMEIAGTTLPVDVPRPVNPNLLSPQMLLQYFHPPNGTNPGGASLLMPLEFVPPAPILAPPSRATYSTP
jgi:hypothetical protein